MLAQDMNNISNSLDKNKLIINLKKGKTESMLLAQVKVYVKNMTTLSQLRIEIKAFVSQHLINTWGLL